MSMKTSVIRAFVLFSSLAITASVLGAQGRGAAPGAGAAAAGAQAAPVGNAENGKKIFSSYGCYQCHGFSAQGGAGARLAPRPIAFAAFSRYVRRPTNQMPPYTAKVVSDQELADIYAFLLTVPQPPAANSIPILAR
jgi:ubiquinol-cytochrome c reductase cytochrome c subunit